MREFNDEDLYRISTIRWIDREQIVNENKDPISLASHYFLIDFYEDDSQKIAVRKAAQVGISTACILRSLKDARYMGINQIHTLPAAEDVRKFVPSKVNQIIEANPVLRKKISKEDAESVGQKQFGKGFIFYKGTNSERESIMLTSDRNIYDEYDFSNMRNIGKYVSRLEGPTSLKQEWWISTPTIPNYGIDEKFNESDQKHLRFNCPHCGYRQHLQWPESVDMDHGRYMCQKCGKTINNTMFPRMIDELDIRWEARYPGEEISGYWISQMIVPWKTAQQLIREFKKAEREGELQDFYNFKLGLPYMSADTVMDASLILKNLTTKEFIETHSCIGVDVQLNELYVIIGSKEAVYGILKLRDDDNKDKWQKLEDLMEVYGARYVVIDAGFKPNEVYDFAKKHPYKVYMAWYQADPKGAKIYRYNEKSFTDKKETPFDEQIKVLIDREKAIDRLITRLAGGTYQFPYSKEDENLKELIHHMGTMYARVVSNKIGEDRKEWASTGKNDYVMAMVYFDAAIHKMELYEEQ